MRESIGQGYFQVAFACDLEGIGQSIRAGSVQSTGQRWSGSPR